MAGGKAPIGKIIGCGCGGLILAAIGGIAVLVFGIFGALKGNAAYKDTLSAVQTNQGAIEALGEPIKAGFAISGSFNFNNGAGDVDLSFPVKGPKGSGTVKVVGEKPTSAAPWSYSTRELIVDGSGDVIKLGP
ncbi:MAG: cytochrome c oxidase assembly factor Coa1 family protein [Verrucomicrobiota bacterium]